MQIRAITMLAAAALAVVLVSGCAGGSGFDPWQRGRVQVSGQVQFETFEATPANGLDFANPLTRPVPGAVVELRLNEFGRTQILSRGNLDANGGFVLDAPANSQLKLVVKSALGDPISPRMQVVDPDDGRKLHAASAEFTTGAADLAGIAMTIDSGYVDGVGLDPDLGNSGAFAILEAIYDAEQLMISADPAISFVPLVVNWGPQNTEGSYYDPSTGEVWMAGFAQDDNDEFDSAIVIHEWGHYFEDNHSRSDSLGGPHGVGPTYNDKLDDTVAWGEGWATALAGMVLDSALRTPVYADTRIYDDFGAFAPSSALYIDIEGNTWGNSDGYWSELSILRLVYDLYDGTNEGAHDTLALGFTPLYDVFVGAQRSTPAFTTIYSFLDALKSNTGQGTAIDAMAAQESIIAANNPFGPSRADAGIDNYVHYIDALPLGGTIGVDPDNVDLATSDESITGFAVEYWPGNKLFQRWLFQRQIATGEAGRYRVRATPTGQLAPNNGTGRLALWRPGSDRQDAVADGQLIEFTADYAVGDAIVFAIGSWVGETSFEVTVTDVTPTPKPQPINN